MKSDVRAALPLTAFGGLLVMLLSPAPAAQAATITELSAANTAFGIAVDRWGTPWYTGSGVAGTYGFFSAFSAGQCKAVTLGPDLALWFVEPGANKIWRWDPHKGYGRVHFFTIP